MDYRDNGSVSVNFGSVAFGYSDGTGTTAAAGFNGIMIGSARAIATIKAIITMIGAMIAMAMTAGAVANNYRLAN
jgi:hypothetical protein